MTDRRAKVKVGDTIVWRQYSTTGAGYREPYYRSGQVFSEAPIVEGLRNAWWVQPDAPEPGEVTAWGVIAVGDASRDCPYWWRQDAGNGPRKGERYGSSDQRQAPAILTTRAWGVQRDQARFREQAFTWEQEAAA